MKTTFKSTLQLLAVASLFTCLAHPAFADATTAPATKDVAIGVNSVYVPGGFDSDTDAYVVVGGLFPNGCYRWKGAEVKNVDTLNHEIRTYATVTQGMCLMVLVPFNREVSMGKLVSGTHNLKFMNGDGTYLAKTLKVE